MEYLYPLWSSANGKLKFKVNSGIGGIWVAPKTDVRVCGEGLDNDFHVAGFTLTGKLGPRIEFLKRFFLSAEARGGYATLPSVLIKNSAPEIADHNIAFLEYYVVGGVYFRIWQPKTGR
jgi:hypothetical protein